MWRRWLSIGKKILPWLLKAWPLVLALLIIGALVALWWWGRHWEIGGYRPFASLQVQLLVTFGIVATLAVIWGIRLRRRLAELDPKRDEGMDEDAARMLEEQARQGRYLDRCLSILLNHLPGRRGHYRLPWYLVLGHENAGKTSLLARSGQNFALQEPLRRAAEAEGVAPEIQWWVSEQGIFLDPAGDFMGNPDETGMGAGRQHLWEQFVDWLREARPRRPLDGILVTLDLAELARQTSSQRTERMQALRARLAELMEGFGTRLPVYVTLTKLDRLRGFDLFFADLTDEEQAAPLGFTFDHRVFSDADSWLDELDSELDGLTGELESRLPHRLSHCHGAEERASVFAFVQQLRGLKPVIQSALRTLLASDGFATPALVRGTYLTSVCQQGVLEDAFLQAASHRYGLPVTQEHAHPPDRGQRYFVDQLFSGIILREAGLAHDSPMVVRAHRRRLALASAACVLFGGLLTLGWHYQYLANVEAGETVKEHADQFHQAWHSDVGAMDTTGQHLLNPLEHLREATLAFGDYRSRWTAVADLGLYQGHLVAPVVEDSYLAMLAHEFVPSLMLGVTDELSRVGDEDYRRELNLLRVLRMLYDGSGRRDDMVLEHMDQVWQQNFPGSGRTQQALREHLGYALEHTDLAREREAGNRRARETLAPFQPVIERTQQRLGDLRTADRVYEDLLQQAEARLPLPMDLRQEVGPQFNVVFTDDDGQEEVGFRFSRIHSREGLMEVVLGRMDSVAEKALLDNWALGRRDNVDFSESDIQQLRDEVEEHYIRDYIRAWRGALESLQIQGFEDLGHGESVLDSISGSSEPLVRLLSTVRENTLLYPSVNGGEDALSERALQELPQYPVARAVEQPFASLHAMMAAREDDEGSNLDELMAAVNELHEYVRDIREASDTGREALNAARARLQLEGSDPVFRLRRLARHSPQPMQRFLETLADESWRVILDEAAGELERLWHSEVVRPFDRSLAGRYPFSPQSSRDAGISDFEAFFGHDGILAEFYESNLKLFVEDSPEQVSGRGQAGMVRPAVREMLEDVERIREAYFTRSGSLDVEFTLEPVHLTGNKRRSVANVDGQILDYSHGARNAVPMIWPNSLRESTESRVTLIPSEVNRSPRSLIESGPWAWFRLLDEAELTGVSRGAIEVAFHIDDGKVTYRLEPLGEANPFTESLLQGFSVPRRLY